MGSCRTALRAMPSNYCQEPHPLCNLFYLLLAKETQAMEEDIKEALKQEYIHLSTSPVSAAFFFVEKKGSGLKPCISYRGLNQVTDKYYYPLPLIP